MKYLFLLAFLCCLSIENSLALPSAQVVDGDSLLLNGQEIRLDGIDAPELDQLCADQNMRSYKCGERAAKYLQSLITSDISCSFAGTDRYSRPLATCFSKGININAQLVKLGLALAYEVQGKRKYLPEEQAARRAKLGVWQGPFERPAVWRQRNHD